MRGLARLVAGVAGASGGLAASLGLVALVTWPAAALMGPRVSGAAGVAMALALWVALAVVGLGTVVGGLAGWHWVDRRLGPAAETRPELMCGGCGYDLRGNRSGACPECGRAIGEAQRRRIAQASPAPAAFDASIE